MFNTTYNHIFKSHNTSLPKCTVCIHIVSLSNTGFILSCNCQVYVKHLIVFRNVNLHLTSKSKATNSILRYRCVEFNLLLVINVHYASIRVRVIVISLARTNSKNMCCCEPSVTRICTSTLAGYSFSGWYMMLGLCWFWVKFFHVLTQGRRMQWTWSKINAHRMKLCHSVKCNVTERYFIQLTFLDFTDTLWWMKGDWNVNEWHSSFIQAPLQTLQIVHRRC